MNVSFAEWIFLWQSQGGHCQRYHFLSFLNKQKPSLGISQFCLWKVHLYREDRVLRPSRSIQRVRSLGHMGIVKLLTDLLRKLLPIFSLVSSDTISEKRVKTRSLRASILSHLITLFCVPLNIQPATLGGQHISQQGRNQNSPATEPQRTSNPWIQCSNIV